MTPFILLVEGIDRAGKTTECNQLVDFLTAANRPVELKHFGAPDGNPFEEYREAIALAVRAAENGVCTIFDRMHWSNKAYDLEYRGPESTTRLSDEEFNALEDMGLRVGMCVVLKTRDPEEAANDVDDEEKADLMRNGPKAAERIADMSNTMRRLQQTFASCFINTTLRKFDRPFGTSMLDLVSEFERERAQALRHAAKRRGRP